jgi:hypothetical protein
VNQYEHTNEGTIDLDIFITRTEDLGLSFLPVTTLAEGPAPQFESQLRCTPDGMTMWAVWNEDDGGLGVTNAMFRRTP